jgi:hypothetical protein
VITIASNLIGHTATMAALIPMDINITSNPPFSDSPHNLAYNPTS